MADATPAGKMPVSDRRLHAAFEVSLAVKGVFAVLEIVGGLASYLAPQDIVLRLVERMARERWLEGRSDFIAQNALQWAQGMSISARHFAAAYLVSHGIVKLWLIIGLMRGKLTYYPIAIVVFALFIAYQLYRFSITHSIWLIVITIVDVAVIVLTWYEYRFLLQRGHGTATDRR